MSWWLFAGATLPQHITVLLCHTACHCPPVSLSPCIKLLLPTLAIGRHSPLYRAEQSSTHSTQHCLPGFTRNLLKERPASSSSLQTRLSSSQP
ncbi:Hypothetical predicted protein [Pelobates cultripes]|uniref:Secreted protein n=1 Tax=Pelobates cultripes TaxID=61616 RepID=A0AAD1WPU8_PELCU|nr:Hypothetical predicted protein [Pelobates cultripes]